MDQWPRDRTILRVLLSITQRAGWDVIQTLWYSRDPELLETLAIIDQLVQEEGMSL